MGEPAEDEDADFSDIPAGVLDGKIAQYEGFIDDVLKRQLQSSLDDFRRDAEVLEQCRELRRNVDLLVSGDVQELETMIDLGCQFFAKASVPDTSRLFVDIGLGFKLDMTLAEACDFLEHKEAFTLQRLELRKKRTAQIKADIREALHLLDMMMQIKSGSQPWLEACDEALIESFS